MVSGSIFCKNFHEIGDQKGKGIPSTKGGFSLAESPKKLTHLPNPADANPNKVKVPFPLKKLVLCPVDIVVRNIGKKVLSRK